ncbi:AIR synthase-related protein [Trema orientale]|uniref:AIR synthase-related protein n=1 Tax=Trema orientale TaxID=63057 RepID=A0A2P5CX53_TREOI|nr:AIR synthase-related protein [Trema orientale]
MGDNNPIIGIRDQGAGGNCTSLLTLILTLPEVHVPLIGEQPIKGLLNPKSMARLAFGEALTDLVWAEVTSLADVKASGNWMYAAKLGGEGAAMYDAANALSEAMIERGIGVDGGKDSVSMAAAHAGGEEMMVCYFTFDLAKGKRRLGGSALAQVLLDDELISAGHDIIDGGLMTCALEMAFAGNCGIVLDLNSPGKSLFQTLFAEELGLIIEQFYKRPDTFSLGICYGCELMALLGWIPGPQVGGVHGSWRGSTTAKHIGGVGCAHGEGRAYFPDDGVFDRVLHSNLDPTRYCDDDGSEMEQYPFNQNGSPFGIAALCSPDGRHLAMMPHPERCFLMW